MRTLLRLSEKPSVPVATAWYLTELGEARGKQELFTKQSPEKLRILREHAVVESAVSSNRIEGVEIDEARVGTVVFGESALQDRNEEEIRGYRNALKLLHEKGTDVPVSEQSVRDLHRMCRGEIWDAGKYKEKDGDIIERYPDGRSRVRFKTVTAVETPSAMSSLIENWDAGFDEGWAPSLLMLAAFNLDLLCIHPFRDGNGRVSRLVLLLQLYHLGFEVGRYISLEKLIEENKERYYETLEQSSQAWHDGQHDFWPYTNYLLSILATAYRKFEARVGQIQSPRGAKSAQVLEAISRTVGAFRISEIQTACPGVSLDTIRRVLRDLQNQSRVECLGRGASAAWRKAEDWELGYDNSNGA